MDKKEIKIAVVSSVLSIAFIGATIFFGGGRDCLLSMDKDSEECSDYKDAMHKIDIKKMPGFIFR